MAETIGDLPQPIEDYALIGDCTTAALVGRNGSIDWLCWPRFDSEACFAALLGTSNNGRWLLAPEDARATTSRSYHGDTMLLETVFETVTGSVALIDFMPVGRHHSSVVRRVEGRSGRVGMRMQLTLRFDFGSSTPWVEQLEEGGGISAILGPNLVVLRTSVELEGRDRSTFAAFEVSAGERVDFALTWSQSHLPIPAAFDAGAEFVQTDAFWREWSGRCEYSGRWRDLVTRSLLTLKALTYGPTGGIVAAPTTSLPEQIGGVRNWDYRFCWLRDASLTLIALMDGGYREEAQAWYRWLHRAVAGAPKELQIMYGIGGERRLVEWSADWLPGYENSSPVHIGNAASEQLQLDIHGEVIAALHIARDKKLADPHASWDYQVPFVEYLESIWEQPDDGIWEVRGERRHFTHSKVMAWVALDRSIRDAERFNLPAPLDRWKDVRSHMHSEICEKGFDKARNTFTQSYGRPELDASLLLIPKVGFLPGDDPRVVGTVEAIERELLVDGFVLRYRTDGDDAGDGLPPGEGAFLPCSYWLVDAYALQGRLEDAEALFGKLIGLVNDVGLVSEEYDQRVSRQVGNFPQAFSHLALLVSAMTLNGSGAAQEAQH